MPCRERALPCRELRSMLSTRAAASAVWLLALPSCLGRKCGQAEINSRSIDGCTSFEHVRLLGHGAAVCAPTSSNPAYPSSRRASKRARVPSLTRHPCCARRCGSVMLCTTTQTSSCSTCITRRSETMTRSRWPRCEPPRRRAAAPPPLPPLPPLPPPRRPPASPPRRTAPLDRLAGPEEQRQPAPPRDA